MARKFSLKDNPIFQRLELPTQPSPIAPELEESQEAKGPSEVDRGQIKLEDQKQTLKNRPSKTDPQDIPDESDNGIELASSQSSQQRGEAFENLPERNLGRENQEDNVDNKHMGQILTLKNRPSKFDPIEVSQKQPNFEEYKPSDFPILQGLSDDRRTDQLETKTSVLDQFNRELPDIKLASAEDNVVGNLKTPEQDFASSIQDSQEKFDDSSPFGRNDTQLDLREHIEKSLFFTFYNEVSDHLLPTLEPAEQVLYARLFRLSYGFNKNYCTVSHPLLQERTGLSRNTVRTSLQSLLRRGLILVVNAGKHIATTYRVFLLSEKGRRLKTDPQKQRLKNRGSKTEAQKQTLKNRGSKHDFGEDQILDLQILTLNKKNKKEISKNKMLQERESKIDPQKMTPLLTTNNSLTLSGSELSKESPENENMIILAKKLVEDFYIKLSLTPSVEKIARGTAECRSLLEQGFTESQIRYATVWIVTHHPDTGSFSRIAHFIDQSLKGREEDERNRRIEHQKKMEDEFKKKEEQEAAEEGRRIEGIRASLGPNELEALQHEASELVESEHGNVRFGRETLIQLKVRELIRERYPLLTRSIANKAKP